MGSWPPRTWKWHWVPRIHSLAGETPCDGPTHGYYYRYYPPSSDSYERCVGLCWCSTCREYTGNMVYVPRTRQLDDPLAAMNVDERNDLRHSERRLVDFLDRLIRRGIWTPAGATKQKPD